MVIEKRRIHPTVRGRLVRQGSGFRVEAKAGWFLDVVNRRSPRPLANGHSARHQGWHGVQGVWGYFKAPGVYKHIGVPL